MIYLPKHNYILSGSQDRTINVLSLNDKNSIKKITDHNNWVTSILLLSDETFSSASRGVIKIWSIKSEIECIKTIDAHEKSRYTMNLHLLGNNFMISQSDYEEFKIWDLKNYECLKTYREDTDIYGMNVTKNSIITRTKDNKVNVLFISK